MHETDDERTFSGAREKYKALGVDVDAVLKRMENISISLHCWQGDDVAGFEKQAGALDSGGIKATGNFPGRARTPGELRSDVEKALSLVPGTHRLNLHAMYGEFKGTVVDRDAIGPEHFQAWMDWAREKGIKLDFNATLFAHPKAASGFTLSDKNKGTREFWIAHVQACREIAETMGKTQGDACTHNLWIPDGAKDITVDRAGHRALLVESLDEIFATKRDHRFMRDYIEGKLFGIGSESFVVGSHEFYLGYALTRNIGFTMDMGHYHPTESVADKISAILPFTKNLLLHVSRGVRWDSDHVVIMNDDLVSLAEELVRAGALDSTRLALDYFDASINRIGAWVIGARATLKAVLYAILQPRKILLEYEEGGKHFQRLALLEELKGMPFGAVWDQFCVSNGVPAGMDLINAIEKHENKILRNRA